MGRAVVYREHTLGVMVDRRILQILASSVLRGAPFFQDDWLFVSDDEVRTATVEDFDIYRVMYHPDYLTGVITDAPSNP